MRYGSIPAGGLGTRLQPIGFSKELAPVMGQAVIEYLLERLVQGGIHKIFINTASDKSDLITYLSSKSIYKDHLIYMVRGRKGLFDGVATPSEFLRDDDELYFGLPDTIWYPKDAFAQLSAVQSELVLGLFDTGTPERFDSVVINKNGEIQSIEVKVQKPKSVWTWAIGKMTVRAAKAMREFEYGARNQPRLFGDIMSDYLNVSTAKAIQLKQSSCLDIGIPSDYEKANAFVKDHEV